MEAIWALLSDANTQWVVMGTFLLGLSSGVLGSFALLKKQSLIGDAMAHAALPGICLAFLLYGAKSIPLFLIGAALAGLVATFFIYKIIQHSRIKEDTAIGLVLSVFFGFGIVLLTYINQNSSGNQSGLDDFIFGQAASLVGSDVKIISGIAVVLLIVTALLFKEFKLLTFDPQFARGIGLPTGLLNAVLVTCIVSAVVIGLQAVGVILMCAMLITPAIAARYWTERLDRMVIIAGIIGGLSGVLGTLLSTITKGMPTGPLIIVAATLVFLFSLVFAPKRGLLSKWLRGYQIRKLVMRQNVLQTMYDVREQQGREAITAEFIVKKRPMKERHLIMVLERLEKEQLVKGVGETEWSLTEKGLVEAYHVTLGHRLMEVYLMNEIKYAYLDLRQDSGRDIMQIPEKEMRELKQLLVQYGRDLRIVPTVLQTTPVAATENQSREGGSS